MKRSLEWIIRGQGWIQKPALHSEIVHVGVEEGSKAVVLIKAVDQQKDRIDRQGSLRIGQKPLPQCPAADAFKPQHQQKKHATAIRSRPVVRRVSRLSPKAAEPISSARRLPVQQPLVLKCESSQGQKHDVVVLHHVLGVVQMGGAEQQCQNARHCLAGAEPQETQEAEADQRRQYADQNVGAVADHDVAHAGVIAVVVGENGQPLDIGSDDIRRQHKQRLTDAVPVKQFASPAMHAEFGILMRKYGRLRGPERMSGLQAMHGVRGAKLSRTGRQMRRARPSRREETKDRETNREGAPSCLALSRSRDRFSRFLVRGLAAFSFTLVPQLLAFGQRDFNFYFTVLEIHPGGDQSQSTLLRLADQLADLFFMHQQLARAQRGVIKDVAVLIRADVAIQQPELAIFDQAVSIFEVASAGPDRFDLGPGQRNPRLKFFQQEVVM